MQTGVAIEKGVKQFPCPNKCGEMLESPYDHVPYRVRDYVTGYGGFLFPFVCKPEGHCSNEGSNESL